MNLNPRLLVYPAGGLYALFVAREATWKGSGEGIMNMRKEDGKMSDIIKTIIAI